MMDELVHFKSCLDEGIGYLFEWTSGLFYMPKQSHALPDSPLVVTRTDDSPKDHPASSKVSANGTRMASGVARPTQVFVTILTL